MFANYHTHTTRCHHALGSEREYIEAAIAGGMQVLGFSDHSPQPFPGDYRSGFRMDMTDAPDYFATLAALREDGIPTEEFLREVERLRTDYGADIHTLEIPAIGISSTDIRNRVKSGRTIHYLVPDRVERYIMESGIYRV